MTKTYDGLANALVTAENIIEENLGIAWKSLLNILAKDPIIEPYYFEIVFIIIAGRNNLRFEGKRANDDEF